MRLRPVLRILIPAGAGRETSSVTPDAGGVFKVSVVAIEGEIVPDGDDLAEVVLAALALWWLVCGEAGVDVRGARGCKEVESVVTLLTAGTGCAKVEGTSAPETAAVCPIEEAA